MSSNPNFIIAKEGYPILLTGLGLGLVTTWLNAILSIPFWGFFVFSIYFFRNPKRKPPLDLNQIVSPADGKIIQITEVDEPRFLQQRSKRISVFMSPFNVHVNRIPVRGIVRDVAYNKGKFFPAFAEKASLDNEQNAIVLETNKKDRLLFVQIAGWLARRIVSYAKPSEQWEQGDIFGLIRFGSRMDIYLPLNYLITVQIGQKVKAGESVLANVP